MAGVAETFCVYHVTAPGMEPGADELPDDFTYPTMDQLSEQVCWRNHIYMHYTCIPVLSPIQSDNSNITITALSSTIFIIL